MNKQLRISIFIAGLTACATAMIGTQCLSAEELSRDAILLELKDARDVRRVRAVKNAAKAAAADVSMIELLCGALKDTSADVRRAAAAGLEKAGDAFAAEATKNPPEKAAESPARAAVPALLEAAGDKDPATRAAILSALGVLAPPGKNALPILINALKDPSPQLRVTAIEALRRHGAAASEALPALVEMALNEKHPDAINALAASLAENNPIPTELAPFYVNALRGSVSHRAKAVEALNKIGSKAIPAVLPQLKSELVLVRREAAAFLERFAKDAKDALPQLVAALSDSDAFVRKSAAAALGALGADALPVLPDLIKLLETNDGLNRANVAGVIETIGAPAKDAVPALLLLIQDKTLAARTAAGKALAKMGPTGLDALLAMLKSPRDEVRAAAALALPLCGAAAMPGLADALKSDNTDMIGSALSVLDHMGGARGPAIAPLIPLLRHKLPAIRSAVPAVLAKCGARAVKPLIDALESTPDATPELRSAITDALGRAGKDAIPPLIEIIKSKRDAPPYFSAIEALGKIGPAASDATPLLMDLLTVVPAPPPAPPSAVKRVVAAIQPPVVPPPAPPLYVRIDTTALQALAGFGRGAEASLPLLFELLKDGDGTVRSEAARAISKIAAGTERVPPLAEIVERCDPSILSNALRVFQDSGMEALLVEFDTTSLTNRQRVSATFNNLPGPNVLPFLVAALKNEEPRIRSGVAMTFADKRGQQVPAKKAAAIAAAQALAAQMEPAMAALKEAVKDSDPDVRVLAAYAYQKAIDAEDSATVAHIATGLAQCAVENRTRGMIALEYYNLEKTGRSAAPALPMLIRQIGNDPNGVPSARLLVQHIGITKNDVPVLVDALKEKTLMTRRTAMKMLEALGPEAKEATGALIESMGEDAGGKSGVEPILVAIGPEAVPPLIEALKSVNTKIRLGSALTLSRMNLDGEWLGKIAAMLSDDRAEARMGALTVLSTSVDRAKHALPYVHNLLLDSDKLTYRAGLELFAVLGIEATPALLEALKDTLPQTRARAAIALKPRGTLAPPPEALKPLMALLNDDSTDVKAAALQTLSGYDDNAAEIVPGLVDAMKDESPILRRSALTYLKHHGTAAPAKAVEALSLAMKDTTLKIRLAAIDALKDLGAPAGPVLFEALGDPEHRVRAEAAATLEALGLANDPAKKILIDEMFALDAIEQYALAQEEHFIKVWDENRVHFYAAKLGDLTVLPKTLVAADNALEAPVPYNGFLVKMLEGQGANAPGGAKKYVADGKMSQGHALAAYPAEYGKTGRFAFLVGDDGTIYKKDLGPDTARLCGELRELNPDETWTKFKAKPKDEGPVRFHPTDPEGEDMEF